MESTSLVFQSLQKDFTLSVNAIINYEVACLVDHLAHLDVEVLNLFVAFLFVVSSMPSLTTHAV